MKPLTIALLLTTLTVSGIAKEAKDSKPASDRVTVSFDQPEKFTDVNEEWGSDTLANERHREWVLAEMKAHIKKTAAPLIADGQRLEVKVTDIDLAGDFEPWRGSNFHSIRVVKDLYPPRMDLEFRLVGADGSVIREGKRELKELSYMMSNAWPSSDSLRYEKEMVRSWIRQEFKRPNTRA